MRAGDPAHNAEVLRRYLTVDLAAQLRRPTGHAVHPVPLTEAERVPTGAENLEVQLLAHELEADVRRSGAVARLGPGGAARGRGGGVRADVPGRGARGCSTTTASTSTTRWRCCSPCACSARPGWRSVSGCRHRGRSPTLVPWKARHVRTVAAGWTPGCPTCAAPGSSSPCSTSTTWCATPCSARSPGPGRRWCSCGSDATPAGVVHAAVAEDADVVVLGTYNGAALAVGRELAAAVAATGFEGAVIIGGRLNQDAGGDSPVDVADDLRALGLQPAATLADAARLLGGTRRRTFT